MKPAPTTKEEASGGPWVRQRLVLDRPVHNLPRAAGRDRHAGCSPGGRDRVFGGELQVIERLAESRSSAVGLPPWPEGHPQETLEIDKTPTSRRST
jgi:hypothetical protein